MKAKRLFVICLGVDTSKELGNAEKSLADRLVGRATEGVALLNSVDANTWGQIRVTGKVTVPIEADDTETDIGVYIIGHHAHNIAGISGFMPADVIALLRKLGFKHIRKLCLLACFLDENIKKEKVYGAGAQLAGEANTKTRLAGRDNLDPNNAGVKSLQANIEVAQLAAQGSYIGTLAKLLAVAGIKPMIAGWDSFVTACYPGHVMPGLQAAPFAADSNVGRKVVQARSARQYRFANPKDGEEASKAKKTVVRWEEKPDGGGGLLVLDQDGWSDRNRMANL